jgi:hypothetical protein
VCRTTGYPNSERSKSLTTAASEAGSFYTASPRPAPEIMRSSPSSARLQLGGVFAWPDPAYYQRGKAASSSYSLPAMYRSTSASRIVNGTIPTLSTTLWKSRSENSSPSAARAFSRSSTIVS